MKSRGELHDVLAFLWSEPGKRLNRASQKNGEPEPNVFCGCFHHAQPCLPALSLCPGKPRTEVLGLVSFVPLGHQWGVALGEGPEVAP